MPRWFYVVIAISILLVSSSIAFSNFSRAAGAWTLDRDGDAFNSRTGELCGFNSYGTHKCINLVSGRRPPKDTSAIGPAPAAMDTGMRMSDSLETPAP